MDDFYCCKMFIRGDSLVACMSFIVAPCLQRNRIQETIPHECVIYLVDDFRENNWYSIKDFKIKTNVGRTRTINYNIFKLKFTISTIVKQIAYVSSFYYPSRFADIINRGLLSKRLLESNNKLHYSKHSSRCVCLMKIFISDVIGMLISVYHFKSI